MRRAAQALAVVAIVMALPTSGSGYWLQPAAEAYSIGQLHDCDADFRSSDELLEIIRDVEANPPALSGYLPPILDGEAGAGASFSVRSTQSGISGLTLDGQEVLDRATNPLNEFPPVPFNKLAKILEVLERWSDCVRQLPEPTVLSAFLTDHALTWVYAEGDPFHVAQTPLSAVYSESASRSIGSLPLVVLDGGQFSDGRVALLIAEGSALRDDGQFLAPLAPASIWLFKLTNQGWLIDGVIGGFTTTDVDWVSL